MIKYLNLSLIIKLLHLLLVAFLSNLEENVFG